jgi:formylglycine-generating enzyme required for sulfatase activity
MKNELLDSNIALIVTVAAAISFVGCGKSPQAANAPSTEKGGGSAGSKAEVAFGLGNGVKMEFILIQPGSFTMGSDNPNPAFEGERPPHKVTITKPFYLGKHEVTQEQWEAVMGSNPSHFKGPKRPIENVSWNDCQDFLAKLKQKAAGYDVDLPTEAQWEYACRAGSTGRYCYGDEAKAMDEYAWDSTDAKSETHPVGEKKPNAWGLYDIHGNVAEWCKDFYYPYTAEAASDPLGTSGTSRVWRGGNFTGFPEVLGSPYRGGVGPTYRHETIGLRCVAVKK